MQHRTKKKRSDFYEPLHKTSEFWLGIIVGGAAVAMFFLTFFDLR